MAARKKTPTSGSAAEFTVVVEDLRSQFKAFGELLGLMRADMNDMRTDANDMRADMNDIRTDVNDMRAENNNRFDAVDRELGLVKLAVLDLRQDVKKLDTTKVGRAELEAILKRARSS